MERKYKDLVFIIKILLICPLVFSCQTNSVTYQVKENYRGPCIVFETNADSLYGRNLIEIDSTGFARANKKGKSGGMSFKIHGSSSELDLIDMPYLDKTKNDYFAVYGFFHANISSDCDLKNGVEFVEFFIGTKSEYIAWRDKYEGGIEYLDKKGIDWCKYYRNIK